MLEDMFERLAAPFSPDAISWRVGSTNQDKTKGLALAYLDARDVMDRLDLVCGPDGWQNRYSHVGGITVCELGVRVQVPGYKADETMALTLVEPERWIWKADGAGASDIEAEKGALSDAFKRAAVRFGIGRYLYHLPSPWVELEPAGRSVRIKDSEHKKLEELLSHYMTEYEWGSPESRATLRVLVNTIKSTLKTADDVRLFRDENKGVMAQMRVKARARVEEELLRVEEAYGAVA